MAITGITSIHTYNSDSAAGTANSIRAAAPLTNSTFATAVTLVGQYSRGWDIRKAGRIGSSASLQDAGGQMVLGAAQDFSGASTFLAIIYRMGVYTGVVDLTISAGVEIFINTGGIGDNERSWTVDGQDTLDNVLDFTLSFIDLSRTTDANIDQGTLDLTDVTNLGFNLDFDLNSQACYMCSAIKVEPLSVTGDDGGAAYVFQDVIDYGLTFFLPLISSPSPTLRIMPAMLHIGDGSTATKFTQNNLTLNWPAAVSYSAPKYARNHVDINTVGVVVNLSASCVVDLDNMSWVYDQRQVFKLQGTGVAFAANTVTGSGTTQIVDAYTLVGWTFDNCDKIEVSLPTFDGTTVRNALGTGWITDTNNADVNIVSVIFDACVVALEVDLDINCALDVTNITFNSNCTDYIQFNGTSGKTLTVTSPAEIAVGKLLTPNGGAITVVAPSVTERDVSVTNMPTAGGAIRLQLINNSAIAASDWTASTAYSAGAVVLRTSGIGAESVGGLYMRCTIGGTSNTLEPTWDTTVGNTSPDTNGTGAGDVVWTTYAVIYYDADPSGTSLVTTYEDGEEFVDGETFAYRFAELNGATTFKLDSGVGLTTTTGLTVLMASTADAVYATNAVDGSAVTQFTADYANNEVDLSADADFTAADSYAFYNFSLTSSQGMYLFWAGIEAPDVGNYKVITATLSLKFDNTTTGSVVQTDSARIYRDDGVYPVKDPTTSGYGVQVNWQLPVYSFDGGGGGFTSGDRATLDGIPTTAMRGTDSAALASVATETRLAELDASNMPADIDAIPTTAMRGTDSANTTTPPTAAANAAAVQASADASPLASNAKQMNDATIYGDGTVNDKWTGEAP